MAKKVQYNVRLPDDGMVSEANCPILYALDVIGGKWKLPILWFLGCRKTVRYNELKRGIKGISNMMLTKCLREMEAHDLIRRIQHDSVPPHVEYSLTEHSNQLLPALNGLYKWGEYRLKSRT